MSSTRPDPEAPAASPPSDDDVVWRTRPGRLDADQSRSPLLRLISKYRYQIYPIAALVGLVVVWESLVRLYDIQPIYLPPPSAIAGTFFELVADGEFYGHLAGTLTRIFAGFFIGAAAGIVGGMLMSKWKAVRSVADALISMFYPLPKIALIPLLIVWLGLGDAYKIVLSAFASFFPVVISTYVGVTQVDQKLKKAAIDLGCTGRRLYQRVILPAALPSIMGGVRLGLGVSIIVVIGAEMVGGNEGVGYLLILAGQILQIQRVFAILVVLTVIGYVLLKAELVVEKRLMPWSQAQEGGIAI